MMSPTTKTVTHVPEHLLPMSPVCRPGFAGERSVCPCECMDKPGEGALWRHAPSSPHRCSLTSGALYLAIGSARRSHLRPLFLRGTGRRLGGFILTATAQ